MALELLSSSDHSEEDYIDMEVSSYSNLFQKNSARTSFSSPQNNPREFEFQMSSTTRERDTTTSPADELFYKGKLLPLHLPPRLQMVEKLLENSNSFSSSFSYFDHLESNESAFDNEFFSTPLATTIPTPTTTSTPFESCNISPSESFRISREINPQEYMYECSTELLNGLNTDDEKICNKKSLSKKIKQSSLGSKFKASRAYLKSLFGISGCSNESSTAARKVADEGSAMKFVKASKKKNSFGQIQRTHKCQTSNTKETTGDICQGGAGRHRRSFSMALRRHSSKPAPKSSSSSSPSSSSGSSSFSLSSNNSNSRVRDQLKYLKRCGSANYSESENSIQGAIAHCKNSQQIFSSRSSVSASRIGICAEQERNELCRG